MFGKSIKVNTGLQNGSGKAVAATPSILSQVLFESRERDRFTRRFGPVERGR
jgi:hypothetical protein